jgi:hypothetical protein
MKGIDIAWARPDTDGIKATGAKWVARYFSQDPTKNLTADEVAAYTAAGLAVVAVWEYTAGAALEGRDKGVQDASQAYSQQKAVGLPRDMPIYFAVDTDAEWSQAEQYFAGVASVVGVDYVGVYGGIKVIEGAAGAGYKYLWQTSAWSDGQWYPHASIRQDGGTVLSGAADVDDSETADFGQYPRPVTTPPAKPPAPPAIPKEIKMIMVTVNRAEVPITDTWPGVFLLADGKLNHVALPEDQKAFTEAGIGTATISWDQYQSLLAGK